MVSPAAEAIKFALAQQLIIFLLWPPNSPDLNPVDYKIWGAVQQQVYQTKVHNLGELKQRLVDVWQGMRQSIIDDAIDEWQKRLRACVRAKGGHFEHLI